MEEMDARTLANAIAEAEVKQHDCQAGGDVVYLKSTGGYLRLVRDRDEQLRVVGAFGNSYLGALAKAIALAIGAIAVTLVLTWLTLVSPLLD